MPAPVDPTGDFLAIYTDEIVNVQVQLYIPGTATVPETPGPAITTRAVCTHGRVDVIQSGDGQLRATKSKWWLLAADLGTRPTLQSLILDTGRNEQWVIDDVDPDPYSAVYRVNATLTKVP